MKNEIMETATRKTLCFTGRRPKALLGGMAYSELARPAYGKIVGKVLELLVRLYDGNGYRTFISGGAQGFDQLAFRAVEELKKTRCGIKNLVYAPCRGQESRWSEDGPFGKAEYRRMLDAADGVRFIHGTYTGPKVLFDRNAAMLDDSDLVIGFYPDASWTVPGTRGGTAGCLADARRRGRRIIQIMHVPCRAADTMRCCLYQSGGGG